jgi:hypothetical protein
MAGSRAAQSVTVVTTQPIERARLERLPGVQELTYDDGVRARFRTTAVGPTVAELMRLLDGSGNELVELLVRKASLEDVFIELTGTSLRD